MVDHSQSIIMQHGSPVPMVVHCHLGSDRSSMFVGLSILVQQLRIEHRVDVFIVARKLRSQRQAMINSYVCTFYIYHDSYILSFSNLINHCLFVLLLYFRVNMNSFIELYSTMPNYIICVKPNLSY